MNAYDCFSNWVHLFSNPTEIMKLFYLTADVQLVYTDNT